MLLTAKFVIFFVFCVLDNCAIKTFNTCRPDKVYHTLTSTQSSDNDSDDILVASKLGSNPKPFKFKICQCYKLVCGTF